MNKSISIAIAASLLMNSGIANAQDVNIGKNNITLNSDVMTPETLWAMGRIAHAQASPDGSKIVYQVGYYSVKEDKGHQVLCMMDANGQNVRQLTTSATSESSAAWLDNTTIAFLSEGQIWTMKSDGSARKKLTNSETEIEGFLFSPDRSKVILHPLLWDYQQETFRLAKDNRSCHYRHELPTLGSLCTDHRTSLFGRCYGTRYRRGIRYSRR